MFFDNRLTKVKSSVPGLDSLLFTYCGLGKRIKKTGATDTTGYVYDGMYAVCEFDGSDNLKASYVYANGMLLGTSKTEYGPGGPATVYYHHDGLGSTMGLTDETGNVAQAYLYDEFGNLIESWGATDNRYLYTGQEWDSEIAGTELYNLRARYYDTGIGRFISEDPSLQVGHRTGWGYLGCCVGGANVPIFSFMGSAQDLNGYLYAANNPVNLTDPVGLQARPGCTDAVAREEMRRIREAYRACLKEMPYGWGLVEWIEFWKTGRKGGGVCADQAGWVGTCIRRRVRMPCCTLAFVCHIFHATLRIDCYAECGRLMERRRADPWLRPPRWR